MFRTLLISLAIAIAVPFLAPRTASADKAKPEVAAVLAAYERARAQLAADKTAGLAAAARDMATAARKGKLDAIAKAAPALEKAKDLAAARKAFGALSRPVVALVESDASLKKRLRVFECPMADAGANQWVQPGAEPANPYMGAKMLTCGGEVK
jgi:hypothetical protein